MYVYQKLEYNVSFEPWKKPLKAAFFEIYDDLRQQPTHFEQSEEKKIQGIYFLEIETNTRNNSTVCKWVGRQVVAFARWAKIPCLYIVVQVPRGRNAR